MASLISDPNGRKRIQFVAGDGIRKTIRLGKISSRKAERIKPKVEDLIGAMGNTGAMEEETVQWLKGLDDRLYGRLAVVGLVKPRGGALPGKALDAFLGEYLTSRVDIKPGT